MAAVKTIGASGQISLGKEYAGQTVIVDQVDEGTWIIKLGSFVPRSEQWLHDPAVSEQIDRAIAWAEANPPTDASLDEIEKRLGSA